MERNEGKEKYDVGRVIMCHVYTHYAIRCLLGSIKAVSTSRLGLCRLNLVGKAMLYNSLLHIK